MIELYKRLNWCLRSCQTKHRQRFKPSPHQTSTAENSAKNTHNAKNIARIRCIIRINYLPIVRKQFSALQSPKSLTKTRLPLYLHCVYIFERARVKLRMLKWYCYSTGSERSAQLFPLAELISFPNVTRIVAGP